MDSSCYQVVCEDKQCIRISILTCAPANRVLRERTRRIVKRSPQGPPTGITIPKASQSGNPDLAKLIGQLAGNGAPNKNQPNSSVPETIDMPPQAWKEAKRTKIRYGPYRIPPTSENNIESQVLNVQGMFRACPTRSRLERESLAIRSVLCSVM